ncbi:Acyl-CoA desaturase {ECO:0000305/PubMed:8538376}; AltName: Full=Delta(9)-desaturase {ECO:0000305}; Short=Delta-9 desaturase {ECO:0000305}; AltName: Full=Fatty acid desaturase {ECO:0000305}; AltName: Full=Stearoyl-CoA desaturase {ECO:0000305} [Serendipita indica DSM 11827]|nr:Acyl-CoA desaturase {ECO:0000305/PubMed:8538376}; AltName: Full=Delta(9)-desaturase {ECO:0000305}; Short=Delta-9 desaturase {ECO:0000305}; AltName: Full=Fatty acid desaturase {ECO:0000305}; AltName: Full=Stearoyl-CoA desaturase {ECO:0000305} [Serendipita indica DSM 11827]
MQAVSQKMETPEKGSFWLPNAFFFALIHLGALLGGIYLSPPSTLCKQTIILTILCWQLPCFGQVYFFRGVGNIETNALPSSTGRLYSITIGYHRLWSHKAFRAVKPVRFVLAIFGTMAFQGSIKWWVLRHRLHHRFTDDPVHDPYVVWFAFVVNLDVCLTLSNASYAATRGLFFSHMGWIFRKPTYTKLPLIEKDDLDRDPIVRFQHKYYVPLALFTGLVLPTMIAATWGDAMGGYIWGGLVGRVLVWHCTFLVNSLAHWEGLQPYTDEITARGNLIMAMLTCGEGNHNFHAFPHDFRAGPNILDWDPSKWIITMLYRLGLATGLRKAHPEDIKAAQAWILSHHHEPFPASANDEAETDSAESTDEVVLAKWSLNELNKQAKQRGCLLVIDGFVVDASSYVGDHPGGSVFLRRYAVPKEGARTSEEWRKATWAFQGGMNVHSRIAKRRMMSMRVAELME